MGYRCRWRFIGRAEPEPKPATTAEERELIRSLRISRAPGRHTIHDVWAANGRYLGQVRTTFAGQTYRASTADEWLWAGSQWAPNIDPPHALALLALHFSFAAL